MLNICLYLERDDWENDHRDKRQMLKIPKLKKNKFSQNFVSISVLFLKYFFFIIKVLVFFPIFLERKKNQPNYDWVFFQKSKEEKKSIFFKWTDIICT